MIRSTRPIVEPLEGRALLSGLAYSLTTDQSVYQPGQPVQMTFRETNVSTRPVTVEDGPSIDGFTVSRDGAVVWRSNAGINPLYIRLETLQPGQSLTLTATWDGVPNGGSAPVPGQFLVSNQLEPQAATATITIAGPGSSSTGQAPSTPNAPGGDPPAASSVALSVATNHPTYRLGHPVRITMILHNAGHRPVDLAPGSQADGFTVLQGTTPIWHRARPVSRRIEPGRSIKLTAVWDGKPGQAVAAIASGTYTVEAVAGGESASTTIRITA
jgi:hypothetical protein